MDFALIALRGVSARRLPHEWIKRAAAIAFIAIGALMLPGKF
jgi:hypothetical protein